MARPVYVIPREIFDARLVDRAVAAGARAAAPPGARRSRPTATASLVDGRSAPRWSSAPTAPTRWPGPAPALGTARRRAVALRGYAPTPPGARGHPGDPLRRAPAAVVRLGLRPRRRLEQRRLRRARGRPATEPSRELLLDQLDRLLPGAGRRRRAAGAATTCRCRAAAGAATSRTAAVLLAGDAAGLVNPMTGEGIYYAVATGAAAGRTAAVAARDRPRRRGRRPAPARRAPAARPAPAAHLGRGPADPPPRRRRGRHRRRRPRPATPSTPSSSSASATAASRRGSPSGWRVAW